MDWKAKVELFEKIRREHSEGVGTILGVAKKLGVHRRIVRETIQTRCPQSANLQHEPLCDAFAR